MGVDSEGEQRGWAGQWDRHRWPLTGKASKSVDPEQGQITKRLRSLDEFQPPPWQREDATFIPAERFRRQRPRAAAAKVKLSVTELLILALAISAGALIGISL